MRPMRRYLRASVAPATVALLAVLVTGVTARGDAGARTTSVTGEVTFTATSENCDSPIGLCATGRYIGSLHGTSRDTLLRFVPAEPQGMIFDSEDEIITLSGGTLITKVSAVANYVPGGEFASIHKVTGGTGDYAGARGYLALRGSATDSGASGTYRGEIHVP